MAVSKMSGAESSYGGYAGYRRACDSLRQRGVAIDVPAAGVLGEGIHAVHVEKILEFDDYREVVFTSDRENASHKQRIYYRDRALGDTRLSVGTRCNIDLGWTQGCYRVERVAEGYVAVIDGEVVSDPYSSMAALDADAKAHGVKRAYLRVMEIHAME